MRIDRLHHLAVIDPESACRSGTVVDYWVNPTAGRVAALAVRPVDVDQLQRVSCARVARIGHDAVMLARENSASSSRVESIPENWLDRRHLTTLVVYTDTGDCLGTVAAAQIDPLTLDIQSYDLAVPFWRRWIRRQRSISGDRVAWCGRDVLVVRTDEPAKLRTVGHEDGDYSTPKPVRLPSHATSASRNGTASPAAHTPTG